VRTDEGHAAGVVARVETAAGLVDVVAIDVLRLTTVEPERRLVLQPRPRDVLRRDTHREPLLLDATAVLVAELRLHDLEDRQVLACQAARLAAIRVAQDAVLRVVRLRQCWVSLLYASP